MSIKEANRDREVLAAIKIQLLVRSWHYDRVAAQKSVLYQSIALQQKVDESPIALSKITSNHISGVDNGHLVNDREKCIIANRQEFLIVALQNRLRGMLCRRKFRKANTASTIIQRCWRRCIISLKMDLLRVYESLCNKDGKVDTSILPPPLKKARSLLPKDSRRLNRIKDITQHLPRNHECGIFVEEILNSVSVKIQSVVRRFLVRRKMQQAETASFCLKIPSVSLDCQSRLEGMENCSIRFSTDDENEMFILAQVYVRAQAGADAVNSSSTCLSRYSKKVIHHHIGTL